MIKQIRIIISRSTVFQFYITKSLKTVQNIEYKLYIKPSIKFNKGI